MSHVAELPNQSNGFSMKYGFIDAPQAAPETPERCQIVAILGKEQAA